jgi:hypothetical protein
MYSAAVPTYWKPSALGLGLLAVNVVAADDLFPSRIRKPTPRKTEQAKHYQNDAKRFAHGSPLIGPIHATREKTHNIPLPPIVGAVALIGGVVLLLTAWAPQLDACEVPLRDLNPNRAWCRKT